MRLVFSEDGISGRGGRLRIYWEEDGELGGSLGQSLTDGTGDAPADRDEWEHWAASRAVRNAPGVKEDNWGLYWETEKLARGAVRIAREALKQERPIPEWAKTALAEGWTPPKGWKV